jgi:hypothetical protein
MVANSPHRMPVSSSRRMIAVPAVHERIAPAGGKQRGDGGIVQYREKLLGD